MAIWRLRREPWRGAWECGLGPRDGAVTSLTAGNMNSPDLTIYELAIWQPGSDRWRRAWDREITCGGIAPTRLFHSIHFSEKCEFSRRNCGFTAQDLNFGRNFLRRTNHVIVDDGVVGAFESFWGSAILNPLVYLKPNDNIVINKSNVKYMKLKIMKSVKFDCKSPTVYMMCTWDFAYRNARRGHWEQIARDRKRFQRRIVVLIE